MVAGPSHVPIVFVAGHRPHVAFREGKPPRPFDVALRLVELVNDDLAVAAHVDRGNVATKAVAVGVVAVLPTKEEEGLR